MMPTVCNPLINAGATAVLESLNKNGINHRDASHTHVAEYQTPRFKRTRPRRSKGMSTGLSWWWSFLNSYMYYPYNAAADFAVPWQGWGQLRHRGSGGKERVSGLWAIHPTQSRSTQCSPRANLGSNNNIKSSMVQSMATTTISRWHHNGCVIYQRMHPTVELIASCNANFCARGKLKLVGAIFLFIIYIQI